MRLHIGGLQPHPEWKILNIQDLPGVDFVGTAEDLSQFADNSVEQIYASHVLEHFSYRHEIAQVLREWFRVLESQGTLMVSVPNLPVLCKLYLRDDLVNNQRFKIMQMMFGGQIDSYDYHKAGLSWKHLHFLLKQAGFKEIMPVEDFNLFNDCSKMKFLGERISLNVTAIK